MTRMAGAGTGAGGIAVLAAMLEQRTGQQIASDRLWRVEAALKPLMRARGHAELDDLVSDVVCAADPRLLDDVIDAMLNQETSFFRDAAVLDLLGEALVAAHANAAGRRLRVWSAGCSTGQEPLSLAMLLEERFEAAGMADIVATDVSDGAIGRARAGRYSQFEIQRGLSVRRMVRWFEGQGEQWQAKPGLLAQIVYRRHNIATDPTPGGRFDVILCRNVFLYFPPDMRRAVFDRLHAALLPGGLLVLGAGETVIGQTDAFVPSSAWRGFYEPVAGRPR